MGNFANFYYDKYICYFTLVKASVLAFCNSFCNWTNFVILQN
jgi:hypothetical protein